MGEMTRTKGSRTLVRLPLQVGSTAHWSFTRVPLPIAIGVVVGMYALERAGEDGLGDQESLTGVLLLLLLALICFAYSIFHLRGAFVMRASDIVIDTEGACIAGGFGRGKSFSWKELAPPYARVEESSERQLSVVGALLFVLSVFRAGWPLRKVTVWNLLVYPGGKERVVARSDREIEARSMEAAAQSIVAIQEGRRHLAEAPTVSVETVACPGCGAVAILDDTGDVRCAHCGATVLLDAHARRQAAAAKAMKQSRERVSGMIRRLLVQPRATPTNYRLAGLWFLMAISWPVALRTFFGLQASGIDEIALGLPAETLWGVPLVVMLGAWTLGRAWLAKRGAMQLLTLGFGALAPARGGEAPRCRRCHGPLDDAGVGAIVRCPYCGSDNVTGIDLRPFVDKARAEQQSLDHILEKQRRSRVIWSLATVGAVLSIVMAGALLVCSIVILSKA